MAIQLDTCKTNTQVDLNADKLPIAVVQPNLRALRLRRAWERGMATAEYAVGILAAVALALVLLNIFKDSEFLSAMLKVVIGLIGKVGDTMSDISLVNP